jgi:hypothetical protein
LRSQCASTSGDTGKHDLDGGRIQIHLRKCAVRREDPAQPPDRAGRPASRRGSAGEARIRVEPAPSRFRQWDGFRGSFLEQAQARSDPKLQRAIASAL